MTAANKDRLFKLFAANLESLEYESSDEKLKTLNQLSCEEDELLRLAMDHAYERGYQEADEDNYPNATQLLFGFEQGFKRHEFESSDEKLAVFQRLSIDDISLFGLAMDVAYEEGMTDAQDAEIYDN